MTVEKKTMMRVVSNSSVGAMETSNPSQNKKVPMLMIFKKKPFKKYEKRRKPLGSICSFYIISSFFLTVVIALIIA